MCPVCLASGGVIAASVVSTGSLTAVLVKVFRGKKVAENTCKDSPEEKEKE
jgi:hypothetical protein